MAEADADVELIDSFGFETLVYDPYVENGEIALAGAEKVSLEDLFERSQFVSTHPRSLTRRAGCST